MVSTHGKCQFVVDKGNIKKNHNLKIDRRPVYTFFYAREDIQMARRHRERFSTLLII